MSSPAGSCRTPLQRRAAPGLRGQGERQDRAENQTLATVTFQNYFRMYKKLAGMTGTADTEAMEFKKTYNLDVMVIPRTNSSSVRTILT